MPHKGYKQTEEHRRKTSEASTGRVHSVESRIKRSEKLKDRPQPPGQIEAQRRTKTANGNWKHIGATRAHTHKGRTYIDIKAFEGRGNKNWMAQHRWVVEQSIERTLESHEEVHHIDGDATNNCIDNLAVISKIDHTLITKLLRAIDGQLARTIVKTLIARFPDILHD